MPATAERQSDLVTIYGDFLDEVEFQCTLCEAVSQDIRSLNSKIKKLYGFAVERSKAAKSLGERKSVWRAAFYVADEIRQAACLKKNAHQICGLDLSTIDDNYSAIKERLEFLLGYKIDSCS